ncbi:MAG: PIN domain-containing protein [Acidimicrobiales bacterium]
MSLLLDAGAFLAVERGDRDVVALVKRERLARRSPLSHGGVVAQIWRGGSGRQVGLARLLAAVDVKALDEELGKKAGLLLGTSSTGDAIDAALVCLAVDGDEILTSNPRDFRGLAERAGLHIDLIPV